jgi:glycosyltransferase involved in cell wall biosynthesis
VAGQIYKNLEIIIVDDGSTDSSGTICDAFAAEEPRAKVLHQKNAGLSAARNAGLDLARGEYIGFVDSDDFVESSMFGTLLEAAERHACPLAACGIFFGNYEKSFAGTPPVVNTEEAFELYLKDILQAFAWNKLYHKSLFENLRYPEGKLFEDTFVILPLLERAQKIALVQKPLYHYLQREGSIVQSAFRPQQMDWLTPLAGYRAYSARHGHRFDADLAKRESDICFWLLAQMRGNYAGENAPYARQFKTTILKNRRFLPKNRGYADHFLVACLVLGLPLKMVVALRELYLRFRTR